ncbi:hypothetical protein QUF74_19435 [Candidatus Halobeggiatoa sp. HSG11]|nr:hypothetical protein [Candidatus Halobeggiatoa sp. HSG11]
MLIEFNISQNEKNKKKYWFQDEYFDLFVWFGIDSNKILNFQLCYDRLKIEKVISWDFEKGFAHYHVDDGEYSPHKNMSPVFIQEGKFEYDEAIPKFIESSSQIDKKISKFIIEKLDEYIQENPHG